MNTIICPRCKRPATLIELGDGIYRCNICGYTGYLDDRDIIKR